MSIQHVTDLLQYNNVKIICFVIVTHLLDCFINLPEEPILIFRFKSKTYRSNPTQKLVKDIFSVGSTLNLCYVVIPF